MPKKFWKDGEILAQELAKSYQHLEKKMSGKTIKNDLNTGGESTEEFTQKNTMTFDEVKMEEILESIEGDEIQAILRDPELVKTLQSKGINNEQMQSIYALAGEHLSPLVNRVQELNQRVMEQELENHFGGAKNWKMVQERISPWAIKNLPTQTVEHLASSVQGVKMLHKMMDSSTEQQLSATGTAGNEIDAEKLRNMMDDPKYWRIKDAEYINRVQQGFKKLYPEEY